MNVRSVVSGRGSVTLPLFASFGVVTLASLRNGKMPSAKQVLGIATAYTLIGFVAEKEREFGALLGWLVFTGLTLRSGADAFDALANVKPVTGLKPFQVIAGGANAGVDIGTTGSTDVTAPDAKVTDTGNYTKGGVGGNWGGTAPVAVMLASVSGLPITSSKRSTRLTASGNVSDHYTGMTKSYAVDLGTSSLAKGDAALARIMKVLGHPEYKGGSWANYNYKGYRVQVGWKVPGHYDHIHIGVRKV